MLGWRRNDFEVLILDDHAKNPIHVQEGVDEVWRVDWHASPCRERGK